MSTTTLGRRRGARRAATALLAAGALLAGGAVSATTAHAAEPASVSGVLTGGGTPTGGSWVTLIEPDGDYVDDDYVDGDGVYSFTDVNPGTYSLRWDGSGSYRQQYLGGTAELSAATTFTLADDEDKTLDWALTGGQTVSGTVKRSTGVAANTWVDVLRRYTWNGVPYWNYITDTGTDEDGNYSVANLLPGTYTVRTGGDNGYVGQFYGGAYDELDAKTFTVGSSAVTGINVTLPLGASVTGVITLPDGSPAGDVDVDLEEFWADSFGFEEVYGDWDTGTNANGQYTFTGLEPGKYTLELEDDSSNRFPEQYLGGVTRIGGAQTFKLTAGKTLTVNAKLSAKPSIAPTTTTVALSTSSRAYGTSSTATVTVAGRGAAIEGSVKLLDGTKTIGTKTVGSTGKVAFVLPASLAVGKHSLKAVHTSTGFLKSSASGVKAFTVTKAKPTVSAKVVSGKLQVTVTATGGTVTGKVTVKKGSKTVGTASLVGGKASVSLSSLGSGSHKLTASYAGSTKVATGSTSVTVKR